MHEVFREVQIESIISAIGGGLILIYGLFVMVPKLFEKFGWISERKRKKQMEKKEERRKEFNEFMQPFSEQMDRMTKDLQEQNLSQMRIEMDKIYELYRTEKAWPRAIRTEFMRLYDIYKTKGGNHYITEVIYPEVMTWDIID